MEVKLVAYCKLYISLTRLCVCSTWQCVWKATDRTISLQLSIYAIGDGGVFRIATRTGRRAIVLHITVQEHWVWLASSWTVRYAPYQRWVLCTRPHAIGCCPHRKSWVLTLPQHVDGRVQFPPLGIPSTSKPWSVLWRRKTKKQLHDC